MVSWAHNRCKSGVDPNDCKPSLVFDVVNVYIHSSNDNPKTNADRDNKMGQGPKPFDNLLHTFIYISKHFNDEG